jgi:hypothetical protein
MGEWGGAYRLLVGKKLRKRGYLEEPDVDLKITLQLI